MLRMILAVFAFLALAPTSHAAEDVLARVRRGGMVRCAVDMTPGFSQTSAIGEAQGFDIDFCRAMAAAVLGDAGRIAIQRISSANKYNTKPSEEQCLAIFLYSK